MAHLTESLDCILIQITRRHTLAVCIDMKYKPFKLIGIMSTAALTLVSLQPVNSSLLLELSQERRSDPQNYNSSLRRSAPPPGLSVYSRYCCRFLVLIGIF